MAVGIVLLVVVLAVIGGVVYFMKAQADAAADRAGIGANEILQSPPTSFPADRPAPPALAATSPAVAEGEPSEDDTATREPVSAPPPPAAATPDASVDDEPEDETDDEVAAARFRVPGARATGLAPPMSVTTPAKPTYPLEPAVTVSEPAVVDADAETPDVPVAGQTDPVDISEPTTAEPEPEPEITAEAGESEADETEAATEPVEADADAVIDLDALEPAGHDAAGHDVVFQPEPDAVDHVLQALINRARFKQVGVEEVATELVERADLRGEEVSDVLAELVGRADDPVLDPARSSELVLFNDAVPSRPGQLTDFAKLNPADKKRIIIRVLCLLVARSEDQQLPPRATADSGGTSWPLARAVWPVALADDEPEGVLPSRLAKSG
jgi:hypothetical protein